MSNIQIFSHPQFGGVRVIGDTANPQFCLADLCKILELPQVAKVVQRLDKDVLTTHPLQTAGGIQQMYFVNEDGLYDVILDSRKPEAKKFRKWITSEVLPAIRKFGVYTTDNFIGKAIANPDFAIRILTELKAARAECDNLKGIIAANQHKVRYYDLVLGCDDLVSVTKIAKDYGMSAVKFNQLLHELGVQFKQGGVWILYQKYAKHGWAQTKTHNYLDNNGEIHCKFVTYWTQKGRRGLYTLLKIHGYIPLIEQEAHNG